jgi:hypothetical protein
VGQGTPPRLASGAIDAMFTYQNIGIASGLSYLTLPAEVNLSDPDQADRYATASYTNSVNGFTQRCVVIRPSFAPVDGGPSPAATQAVLYDLFDHRHHLVGAAHLEPSDLHAGGDPTAIPVNLRKYFHLRRLRLTVEVARNSCDPDRLAVSADGVDVIDTEELGRHECQVTIEAVHRSDAIPVKPSFLT